MDFNAILKNLKKGIIHPIYLLHGEEPYFIDLISDYIEKHALKESEKSFNQTILYGKDTSVVTVAESAMRFPMMAERQVIIVKEAQSLKKIGELGAYAQKPLASTVLVLCHKYKKIDARLKLVQAIKKHGVVYESPKIRDYQLPQWIEKYLADHGYSITPQATQILAANLGSDLSKVANELNKLKIAVESGRKITPEDIEKNIGFSKEFNLFELQNAMSEKNILKANQIIQHFAANPKQNPIQRTIPFLFNFYSGMFAVHFLRDKTEQNICAKLNVRPYPAKLLLAGARKHHPTKLYEIIGILREYDMKSKGWEVSGMTDTLDLQKEMIYKILH